MREIFERIYEDNAWQGTVSRSGPGSDLSHTESLRAALPDIVRRLRIRVLLDVPSGDFFWMSHVPHEAIYVGVDIVPAVVETNVRRYGSARRKFLSMDMVRDALPRADLVLCRDGLVHLSHRDALAAIANIKRSKSRYLLATTFVDVRDNVDVATGGWRPLNLQVTPYVFPEPRQIIFERLMRDDFRDKALGLWKVDELP